MKQFRMYMNHACCEVVKQLQEYIKYIYKEYIRFFLILFPEIAS